jgi:serine/threonine protein kinase
LSAVVTIAGDVYGNFILESGQGIVFGRSLAVEVSIDDLRVSRRHCKLELGERGLLITDLQSANGTYLNGKRVLKALVRPGDRLAVGSHDMSVEVDYKGEDYLERDYKCDVCARSISLSTFADGDVIQLDEKFICPQCRDRRATPAFSLIELGIVQRLFDEGFEILEKLSISGPVPIFKAKKTTLEQLVAIKALPLAAPVSQKKIARFIQEAKAEARLRHPNVVTIYDVRQSKEVLYIVMELIEGQTLHQEIERAGRLATKDALRIAYQVGKALAHAYEKRILHRDVKPMNIMITPEGEAKLIDFGLAKNLWEVSAGNITGEGETLGTVGYMAPEQVRTAKLADHRADIYGLGATLYHCLSGRAPFLEKTDRRLVEAIEAAQPPPLDRLSGVPLNIVAVVAKMMQKRPEDRFQTPEEVLRAIEGLVSEMLGVQVGKGNVEFFLRLRDEEIDLQRTWKFPSRGGSAFLGAFRDKELVEFLQMVEFNKKTGLVEVSGKEWRGKLHLREGRIIAAQTWPQALGKGQSAEMPPIRHGEAAVHLLLDLGQGDFEFTPKPDPSVVPECDIMISRVLLESLRKRDESGSGSGSATGRVR